jgi:Holliday junction resolvasome RuvABC endonuclease subunit
MIVLGIDPGLAKLGWNIAAKRSPTHAPEYIAGGVFVTKSIGPQKRKALDIGKTADKMRRVDELARFLHETIRTYSPVAVAHEGVSLGFHQAMTLFDLGLAFGVIRAVSASRGLALYSVTPGEIKERLTGNRKASKDEVIAAVRREAPGMVWPRATLLHEHQADAWGALVVAQHKAYAELRTLSAV